MGFKAAKERIDQGARIAASNGGRTFAVGVEDWALMSLLIGNSAVLKDGIDAVNRAANRQNAELARICSHIEGFIDQVEQEPCG